jgi:hypothetical protein
MAPMGHAAAANATAIVASSATAALASPRCNAVTCRAMSE